MKIKESKKKILIIVHGVWPFKFKNKFLEKARRVLFRKLTAERGILRGDYKQLADFLKEDYDSINFLKWNGGIILGRDILPAVKRLKNMIKKNKDHDIDIIGVSMGGYITQRALMELQNIGINRVLYVGAVHKCNHDFKNVKVAINVYSKLDKVFVLANDFYNGLGNAFLKGSSIVNIGLPDVKHEDLCKNTKFNKGIIKDFSLFTFYKNLLKSDNFSFLNRI